MIPAERQRFILAHLASRSVLSISELMELLGVSHMTVRRDIQQLEQAGRVMSVSGGVKLPERLAFEPSHLVKSGVEHDQKVRIGRCAAALVTPGAVVYLDAGTTTLEIAHCLCERDDLLVVTNDFVIAAFLLGNSRCRLYHTGGQVERDNQSCVGNEAAETVARFNFDIAFISASSWVISGISSPSELKGAVKTRAVQNAQRSVLVTDSSKYGKVAAFNLLPLDAFDLVITDTSLSRSVVDEIERLGIKVAIANEQTGAAPHSPAANS
jgi:DeoR/GlpR family transcriptional regulator of sugar metabolism